MLKNFIWHLLSVKSPLNSGAGIAFMAFIMVCLYGIADIFTGVLGKDLAVSNMVYGLFGSIIFAGFFKESFDSFKGNKDLEK